MTSAVATEFARKIRDREPAVGYWVVLDSPVSTERIARLGYDYVALDAQHGLIGYNGMLTGLMAIDASGQAAGVVRVEANNATAIGKALDAGAVAVIVPLVDNAQDAADAVKYAKYPPHGIRSYGPMRSALRVGPVPAESDATTMVFAMIETPGGLENVEEIAAVQGLDGLYVGPSDLALAIGAAFPGDPAIKEEFEAALKRVSAAAQQAGIAAGIHNANGELAQQRLGEGYTFATVASDLTHLEATAAAHLQQARS
ncbi:MULTISPECIES: HpcH/HpaI aldolase family protein [Glutamicibacter]|uniref:Aldolase n=1 Tax=Glutamicibacter halophytocola TaxID=1933880 RepID=A0A5B8IXN8_9MICC|nr:MULTISPECIES: aldolase/citrate lyase family protein [Glutamicibacter]ALG30463.1 aldolase [Glutamicibacter halophytocola]MBF6670351.1 aldolase [Glutamicibacter sp. FBE19]NQD41530.1 aldolase [Glutamicibacter halophytocola]QDY66720.1 aldolase [Glutamicibacter halophytocola]UUX58848.1 aldolase/citrate lyase family protein [Glutamicibacter halophytocola]